MDIQVDKIYPESISDKAFGEQKTATLKYQNEVIGLSFMIHHFQKSKMETLMETHDREAFAAFKFEWYQREEDLQTYVDLLPFIRPLTTTAGALPLLVAILVFVLACLQASRISWHRIVAAHMVTWVMACIFTPIPAFSSLTLLGILLAMMLITKIVSYIGSLHIACKIILGILIYGFIFLCCYAVFLLTYTEEGQLLVTNFRLHRTAEEATGRVARLRAENPDLQRMTGLQYFLNAVTRRKDLRR